MSQAYPEVAWRRLNPRKLVIEPLSALREWLPVAIPVLFVGASNEWGFVAIGAALAALAVLGGVVAWFSVRWRVTPERLEVRHGIVSRRESVTPLERVRSVDVTASPLRRMLGIAKVKVGTGASSDVDLDGLAREEAEALRARLLTRHPARLVAAGEGEAEASPAAAAPTDLAREATQPPDQRPREAVIAQLRPRWVAYAPLTLSGLAVVAGAAGLFSQVLGDVFGRLLELPVTQAVWGYLEGQPLASAVAEVVVTVLVVFALASTIVYVVRFWNFRLTRRGDESLRITRGLTTTYSSTVELARVRGVTITRPLLLRLAGAATLTSLIAGQGADDGAEGSALLLPPAPAAEVRRVAVEVLGDRRAVEGEVRQHGPVARRRRHVGALLPPAMAVAAVAGVSLWMPGIPKSLWALPVVLVVLAPVVAEAHYASLGHALTSRHLVARSGVFPQQRTVVQRDGVIAWRIRATWFQRRVGLVTLTAVTAAPTGDARIIDITEEEATRLVVELESAVFEPCVAAR